MGTFSLFLPKAGLLTVFILSFVEEPSRSKIALNILDHAWPVLI